MKKKLALLLSVLMVIGMLAACGKTTDGEGSKLIGVCMQNKSSSINVLMEEALKETFEPMGYEVQVASADDNVTTQLSQVEGFITMGAEMLVVLPCEITTLEESLIAAREQGIKVVISGGTGDISEDAYDAVTSDDEFMIGMYVASIAKTWIEENMDPNGDWDVAFINSTISDDAKLRCSGIAMILEKYLKNADGEYVNLMGEVVKEAEKIENPVYCEMIASRVKNYDDAVTEMVMTDNAAVVSGILTDNPNVRVFLAYNSLLSTAGSQYIMDHYSAEEQKEFAFFSGGVMGNEYEYLIGAASADAGTASVFRGAAQFGGGDAAATLAKLCHAVMTGEAGVDYGKSNPNTIGLYYPITAELNNGVAALVCLESESQIASYTYKDILANEKLMTYWDSKNGYNENMQESEDEGNVNAGPTDGYTAYTCEIDGVMGKETLEFDLYDNGKVQFYLPGNDMIKDVYEGTYEIGQNNVVKITGLTNVDASSEYKTPGLWSDYIDPATGDAVITIDPEAKTFVAGGEFVAAEGGTSSNASKSYTYEWTGPMGTSTTEIVLNADGTCQFSLPGHEMLKDVYTGTYTIDGTTVTIKGLTNVDASSEFKTPGLWDFIDSTTGDAVITIDEAAGTYTPAQ